MSMSVLIAGIGNVFLGDDGFGVEVVRRLRHRQLGAGVRIEDFGIRGIHLAYDLAGGGYDAAILVDAVQRGGAPGTLYAIEADSDAAPGGIEYADAHSLTPDAVLALVSRLGARPPRIVVVGCEPASLDESMELSRPVAASIDGAVDMVRRLVAEMTGAVPCV